MNEQFSLDLDGDRADGRASPFANVVRFPLDRRHHKVIRAAKSLAARRTQEGKQSFWNRTCRELGAELRRHGAEEAEVRRQIDAFREAVSIELGRDHGQQQA